MRYCRILKRKYRESCFNERSFMGRNQKEYKVTRFSYSFHPALLQIIEETINEFLNSEEIQSKIGEYPYEIIIRGKDKKNNKLGCL